MQASLSLDLVAKGCDVRGGCQGLGFRGVRHYPVPQSPIPLSSPCCPFPFDQLRCLRLQIWTQGLRV